MMQKGRQLFLKHHNIISVLLLGLTSFYCSWPIIFGQSLPWQGDMVFHLFQSEQFYRALHDGVLYPRWLSGYNNGYGSPVAIFYAPLCYYFISAIHLFVPSLVISMVVAVWSAFFLSGVTMFIAAKRLFGKEGGLLSAMVYQTLPFHVSDFYVRGSVAGFCAFVWLPLFFLYLYDLEESRGESVISAGLCLAYAGLILTHLVSGFICSFAAGLFVIYQYFSGGRKKLVKTVSSLALGLGITSFYLIPLVYERKFVHIDYIVNSGVGDYRKNFLFALNKLKAGLRGFYMPLHLGVILELALFIIVVRAIYVGGQASPKRGRESFFVLLFLVAFFLTTPLSGFVWRVLPGFSTLQFPWRWVQVMELSLCFLIGSIFAGRNISAVGLSGRGGRWIIFLLVAISVASFLTISTADITAKKTLYAKIGPETVSRHMAVGIEYVPVWTSDIDKVFLEKTGRVSVLSGNAVPRVVEWKSERRLIDIRAYTRALLKVSTFYYPGWRASLDGAPVAITAENGTDAMVVDVPRGTHTLGLTFEDTPLRRFSWILSFCSFLILALLWRQRLRFPPKTGWNQSRDG
jgi:6-pyruvoyl-tetrahydropterin synthase related domain